MTSPIYTSDIEYRTSNPYYSDDKSFITLPSLYTLRVHHPALLKITRTTDHGEETILDNLSSLEEGYIETDAQFPATLPATINVTIITGKTYTHTIPRP